MSPSGGEPPTGKLQQAIDADFGSFDRLKKQMNAVDRPAPGFGLGSAGVGAGRRDADRRAGLRPSVERRPGHRPRARDRRLGARLLPRLPQRQGGLDRSVLGGRRLEVGRRPASTASTPPRRRDVRAGARRSRTIRGRRPMSRRAATGRTRCDGDRCAPPRQPPTPRSTGRCSGSASSPRSTSTRSGRCWCAPRRPCARPPTATVTASSRSSSTAAPSRRSTTTASVVTLTARRRPR